jgi:hypothetical protein
MILLHALPTADFRAPVPLITQFDKTMFFLPTVQDRPDPESRRTGWPDLEFRMKKPVIQKAEAVDHSGHLICLR